MRDDSPVAIAMVIPNCNSGVLRGGNSGVSECRDREACNYIYRGCFEHSDLLKKYKYADIVMQDDEN